MPVLQPGKIYVPKNAEELRDTWLRDIRLAAIEAGLAEPPIQPGTDLYIRATANAHARLIQYANLAISDDGTSVLTATGADLDEKRRAHGLPEVKPSPSTGSVDVGVEGGGTVTIPNLAQLVLPNGLRAQVAGNHPGIADGDPVDIVTIDTGAATVLPAGSKLRFVSPPLNVKTEATVSVAAPLTGGTDAESDDRKRDRILNRLANPPAGGNWSHKIEIALNSLASLQYAFVYPALGGPASEKVVLVRDFDVDGAVFTRELDTGALDIVRAALQAEFGAPFELVVQSAVDANVDVSVEVSIPNSVEAGGDGTGWKNAAPWPPLTGAETACTVSVYAGSTSVTIDADTATPPVAGVTRIVWWSPNDMRFHERTVTAQSGGTTAWVCSLDAPLIDSTNTAAAVGDYISPAAENMEGYGASWLDVMRKMGPGEQTSDANRIPRALREPEPTAGRWPYSLTILQLQQLVAKHSEMTDAAYVYRSATTPTVPGSVNTAPNVFVPRHFGIYPA